MGQSSKKSGSVSERRTAERFHTWSNISFQDDFEWKTGFVRNISATGLQVITLQPLEPGAETTIMLENLIDYENVIMRGHVVWKEKFDPEEAAEEWQAPKMGIHFDEALPVNPTYFIDQRYAKTHENESY